MNQDSIELGTKAFLCLVRRARRENWCMKNYCTTCGSMRFREELKRIGVQSIIDSLYSLNDSEIVEILSSDDPVGIVMHDADFISMGNNLWKADYPEIVLRRLRKLKDKRNLKENAIEMEAQKQELYKKQKQAKLQNRNAYIANHNLERERMIELFSSMDLEEKLRTIAEDKQNLPSYYPIQLEVIPENHFSTVSLSILIELLARLDLLISKRWDSSKRRVKAAISAKVYT